MTSARPGIVLLLTLAGCASAPPDCSATNSCQMMGGAPTLTATTPADQATGVPVSTGFTLVFSLPMKDVGFSLAPAAALQAPVLSSDGKTATFATTAPLQFNQAYVATVSGTGQGGGALGGNVHFGFTTAAMPDTTAPKLVSSLPVSGQNGVPTNASLRLSFDEPIAKASIGVTSVPAHDFGAPTFSNQDKTVTFAAPPSLLSPMTSYVLVIDAADLAGNALDATTNSLSFSTAAAPDTTAPTVLSTTPAASAVAVATTTAPAITFSEAMDATATKAAFSISPAVTCTPGFDTANTTLTCTKAGGVSLSPSTHYTVAVSTAAKDLAGNALAATFSFSFDTAASDGGVSDAGPGDAGTDGGAGDTTPPTVLSTSPDAGATQVDPRSVPSITFSEPVSLASAVAAFSITPAFDGGCSVSLDGTGTVLSCTHAQPLAADAGYTLQLSTALQDLAGNALAQAFSASFTTGALPDTTAPTIVSVLPVDQSKGAKTTPQLVVNFSEPMDQAATQAALTVNQPTGVSLNFVWSNGGTTLTATPTAALPNGAFVTWEVSSAAMDVAGNALASNQFFQFYVRQQTTTTLTPITGGWGYTHNGILDTGSTGLFVGDNATNEPMRAYVSYQLPTDAIDVTSAVLQVYQFYLPAGSPYAPGGTLIHVDGVAFNPPLDSGEANATALCTGASCVVATCSSVLLSSSVSGVAPPELRTATVTKYAQAGLGLASRQLSLRLKRVSQPSGTIGCPDYGTDGDGAGDYVRFLGPDDATAGNRPVLTITYTFP
ncbi:MAG: Ig-like domain-containing protein [Myxococcaceae bacterium]|nr:Ig-like domain-containing protein [Myxococcaceae bacterium]